MRRLMLFIVGLVSLISSIPSSADLGTYVLQWPVPAEPLGLGVDPEGNVWVGCLDDSIRKYSADGTLLLTFGGSGNGDGLFFQPFDMAFTPEGDVYIADYGNGQLQKCTSTGVFLQRWSVGGPRAPSVALDPIGNVYAPDFVSTVRKFDANGALIDSWSAIPKPSWLRVSGGAVIVAEYNSPIVQIFSLDGELLGTFSSGATQAEGIDLESGRLYISDYGAHVIRAYKSSGEATGTLGTFGSGDGEFINPHGVAVVPYTWIYVADRGNVRVQKFALDPTSVSSEVSVARAPLELRQSQPNPFATTTSISFRQHASGKYALTIFNVAGEAVRRFDGVGLAGDAAVEWDGRDASGSQVAPGAYFYRLEAGAHVTSKRMSIVR